MPGRPVGQGDLGFHRTIWLSVNLGQGREGGTVVLAGQPQDGVQIGRRHRGLAVLCAGCLPIRGDVRRHRGPGSCVTAPAGRSAGIDFDAGLVVGAAGQLGRHLGVAVEGEHLLDLELVDGQGIDRQVEGFACCGQGDFGEPGGRHDGLPEHLVVGQPGAHVGADVGLPHMILARGDFDVHAEQRVRVDRVRHRRAIRDPETRVLPGRDRDVGESTGVIDRGDLADRRELGVEGDGVVGVTLQRADGHQLGPVLQVAERVVDGMGEHRVRADLDEGVVSGRRGGDGLVEAHRVAQVVRPVVGVQHRAGLLAGGADHRKGHRPRCQIRERGTQLRQHRVDDRVVGGHADIDPPGQQIPGGHRRDHRVHRFGRPGDHRLAW